MSREFNYRRAHREWAVPQYHALPQAIKDLYTRVIRECKNQNQNNDLGMDWPGPEFKAEFDAIPGPLLAHAGHVIFGLGHWDTPKKGKSCSAWPSSDHGAYWKFKTLCQQSMAARNLQHKIFDSDADWMMDHKEGTSLDDVELRLMIAPMLAPHLICHAVTAINHRLKDGCHALKGKNVRHMFCIGQKHFKSDSIYLDPRAAPCDICGCDCDDHVSDHIVVLKLPPDQVDKTELTEDQSACLKALAPFMTEHKLDGFVFVKNKGEK